MARGFAILTFVFIWLTIIGNIDAIFTFSLYLIGLVSLVFVLIGIVYLIKQKVRKQTLLDKYKDLSKVEWIMSKRLWYGQTQAELVDSFGEPEEVISKPLKTISREVWKYGHVKGRQFATKITLDDGLVTKLNDVKCETPSFKVSQKIALASNSNNHNIESISSVRGQTNGNTKKNHKVAELPTEIHPRARVDEAAKLLNALFADNLNLQIITRIGKRTIIRFYEIVRVHLIKHKIEPYLLNDWESILSPPVKNNESQKLKSMNFEEALKYYERVIGSKEKHTREWSNNEDELLVQFYTEAGQYDNEKLRDWATIFQKSVPYIRSKLVALGVYKRPSVNQKSKTREVDDSMSQELYEDICQILSIEKYETDRIVNRH